MSDDIGFAPPPFKPDEALLRLQRELRDLGLSEREGVFERRGVALARVRVDRTQLAAAVVRKPSRNSPQWLPRVLTDNAGVRDFVGELKKHLREWGDRDD